MHMSELYHDREEGGRQGVHTAIVISALGVVVVTVAAVVALVVWVAIVLDAVVATVAVLLVRWISHCRSTVGVDVDAGR